MFKKKDNVGKEFVKAMKAFGELDPNEVKGFIILVRERTNVDGKTAHGLATVSGKGNVLINLLDNMNQDIIRNYVKLDLLRRLMGEE